jgi:thymidylate synthase
MYLTDIRNEFLTAYQYGRFTTDKSGCKTLEILGASFIADEPSIFGEVNEDYVARELEWYLSQSLNVNDIPGETPKIWQAVASKDGLINSNYGYLVFNEKNFSQYQNVLAELKTNPNSRRAVMIYTRPSIHNEYNTDDMSDFICTNAVQYLIRDGRLHVVVQMRSNDAWAGYRNDYAWQVYVQALLANDLGVLTGDIAWQVGNLHLYERQFYLVEHYAKTGEIKQNKNKQ